MSARGVEEKDEVSSSVKIEDVLWVIPSVARSESCMTRTSVMSSSVWVLLFNFSVIVVRL